MGAHHTSSTSTSTSTQGRHLNEEQQHLRRRRHRPTTSIPRHHLATATVPRADGGKKHRRNHNKTQLQHQHHATSTISDHRYSKVHRARALRPNIRAHKQQTQREGRQRQKTRTRATRETRGGTHLVLHEGIGPRRTVLEQLDLEHLTVLRKERRERVLGGLARQRCHEQARRRRALGLAASRRSASRSGGSADHAVTAVVDHRRIVLVLDRVERRSAATRGFRHWSCMCVVYVCWGLGGLGYVFVTQTDLTLTHTQARTPLSLVSCTNHELQSVQEQHGTEHILSPQHREQHATSSSTATVAWLLLQLARSRAPCATTPRTPPQKQHLPRRHTLATTTNHLQPLAPIHTKSEPSNPGRDTHHGRRTHTQATASATTAQRHTATPPRAHHHRQPPAKPRHISAATTSPPPPREHEHTSRRERARDRVKRAWTTYQARSSSETKRAAAGNRQQASTARDHMRPRTQRESHCCRVPHFKARARARVPRPALLLAPPRLAGTFPRPAVVLSDAATTCSNTRGLPRSGTRGH